MLTPRSVFERVVPVLIGGASAALLVQRPPRELALEGARLHPGRAHDDPRWLPFGTFAISIYGGYFGAAAGVMMLAMFLLGVGEGLPRSNALRNVTLGAGERGRGGRLHRPGARRLVGGPAAGDRAVHRQPLRPVGGPPRARRPLLRRVIALAGLGLAVYLGIQAYG